ncbi:MAG: nucleotidyltransferase family protein, partial [Gemmatimonas sp.]
MGASRKKHDARGLLLLAACHRDPHVLRTFDPHVIAQLDDKTYRTDFLEFASRHGVMGLVCHALLRSGVVDGRPSHADIDTHYRAMSRRAMIMQLERDNVLRTLETHGIRSVLLKGSGLVSTVYSALAERDYGDIDILVSEADINPAVAALATRGYNAPGSAAVNEAYLAHHFHVRVQRAATIVELHWAMTLPRETYALDPAAVMRESVSHAGVPGANVPRAEHILLHMVIENVRDAFTRLTRVVDIDRIIAASPALDWNYLVQCAEEAHLLPALSLVLETSVALLGTPVPDTTLQRIKPPRAVRAHLALFDVEHAVLPQRGLTRPTWKVLLQLWLVNDRSRIGAVARLYRGDDDEP